MAGVTIDEVLAYTADFERSYVAVVRGQIKVRVGQIVYVAFSRDETTMGFGFPKDERAGLVASDPETFVLPGQSDMRFNWVVARMARLEPAATEGPPAGLKLPHFLNLISVLPDDALLW